MKSTLLYISQTQSCVIINPANFDLLLKIPQSQSKIHIAQNSTQFNTKFTQTHTTVNLQATNLSSKSGQLWKHDSKPCKLKMTVTLNITLQI